MRKKAVNTSKKPHRTDSSVRNLVRGFLDKKILEERPSVYGALMEKIYASKNLAEVRWAENELRSNKLYGHVPLPPDFPTEGDPFKPWSLASIESPIVRVAVVVNRINNGKEKLIECLSSILRINEHIFSGELATAAKGLERHTQEFGLSHMLLRKFAFLKSVGGDDIFSNFPQLTAIFDMSKRDIIRPSLIDSYSHRRQFLDVARSILKITSPRRLIEHRKTISAFAVRPFSYTPKEFNDGLEAFSKTSLLDAMVFLDIHFGSLWDIEFLTEYQTLWESVDLGVRSAMKDFSCRISELESLCSKAKSQSNPDDDDIYRHLTAFIECGNIRAFRSVADFYLLHPPEVIVEPKFVEQIRRKIFGDKIEIREIAKENKDVKFRVSEFDSKTAGILQKTVAMAIYFSGRRDFTEIDETTFLNLMNCTTGADQVISRRALIELKREASRRGALLFQTIALCLLAVDPKDSKSEFELRRTSQDLVADRFNSDFAKFVNYLLKVAPQVGVYIYYISTEDFLLQLYHIHRTSAEAIECRAVLHELMFAHEGDKVFQDRADSLRLSAKIAKARQELDDSRIYVDLGRFSNWLKEQRLVNMLQYMRSGAIDTETLDAMTIKDINASQGIEAEIVRELASFYREFCSNKIFGIASYLGRRIRHGTLRGTLLQDIDNLVRERFPDLADNPSFSEYFNEWRSSFDEFIRRMGSDYFHIRSAQKPLGMISAEISDGKKLAFIKAAVKAMAQNVEKFEEPDYYVGLVSDMCWQIAGVDLKNAHRAISYCKVNARVNSVPEALKVSFGPHIRDYVRFINAHIEEKFNTVSNWFERPKISVPSVDLPTLIRVVNEEVLEEFSSYCPPEIDETSTLIILSGVSYHIVYDFLYVTLKNAACHGKPGGLVSLEVERELSGEMISALSFKVESQYKEGDNLEKILTRVRECRPDALESAYVEEGNSGLRKIARLERDWTEVERVLVSPQKETFMVKLELRLC